MLNASQFHSDGQVKNVLNVPAVPTHDIKICIMMKNISTRTLFSLASMVHILLVKVKEMKTAYLTMKPCVKHGDGTFKHINDPSVGVADTAFFKKMNIFIE